MENNPTAPGKHKRRWTDFGVRIRQLRLARGLDQQQLGDLVGLSADQIDKIELGGSWTRKPTFERFVRAFGLEEEKELMDYSGNEAFIASGGMQQRAPRRKSHLIVRRRRVDVVITEPGEKE